MSASQPFHRCCTTLSSNHGRHTAMKLLTSRQQLLHANARFAMPSRTPKYEGRRTSNTHHTLFRPPFSIEFVPSPSIPRQSVAGLAGVWAHLSPREPQRISTRAKAKCASPRERRKRRDCLGAPRGGWIASCVRGEMVQPPELRHLESFWLPRARAIADLIQYAHPPPKRKSPSPPS